MWALLYSLYCGSTIAVGIQWWNLNFHNSWQIFVRMWLKWCANKEFADCRESLLDPSLYIVAHGILYIIAVGNTLVCKLVSFEDSCNETKLWVFVFSLLQDSDVTVLLVKHTQGWDDIQLRSQGREGWRDLYNIIVIIIVTASSEGVWGVYNMVISYCARALGRRIYMYFQRCMREWNILSTHCYWNVKWLVTAVGRI